ncbi:MAG: rhomboid family intramembrane serine protease [Planctomycetota bacterium]
MILLCMWWTIPVLTGRISLEKAGAIRPERLWDGEWWTLVASIFLHGSWWHLALNGISLFLVGRVLERGIGRAAYLFFLFASAEAGVATSLVWNDAEIYRVGISGGIAGLIGLVLALEWSITHSIKGFLKQRNTIVVLILLAINAAFAVYVGRVGSARIDNAGHIGGLLMGLLAGAAFYTRRGLRPARGIAVMLVLLAPTLVYAAHPFKSLTYWGYRYRKAESDDQRIEALRALGDLDPQSAWVAARLADLTDDPAPLRRLTPKRSSDAELIVHTWLELAKRRLEKNPNEARLFAEAAAQLTHAAYVGWLDFGRLADEAGLTDLAEQSFVLAYDAMKARRMQSELWRPAWARLIVQTREKPDLQDVEVFRQWLALAGETAAGLPRVDEEKRPVLLALLEAVREVAETAVRAALPEVRKSMARALSDYYGRLADAMPEDAPHLAVLDLRMAELWWLGAEDPTDPEARELAAGRFETAWNSARRTGNVAVEVRCRSWFDTQKIPHPELADPDDGG